MNGTASPGHGTDKHPLYRALLAVTPPSFLVVGGIMTAVIAPAKLYDHLQYYTRWALWRTYNSACVDLSERAELDRLVYSNTCGDAASDFAESVTFDLHWLFVAALVALLLSVLVWRLRVMPWTPVGIRTLSIIRWLVALAALCLAGKLCFDVWQFLMLGAYIL